MSYNPKTDWQLNEIVMPADMNRIEQGIADLDSHSINYLGEITDVTNILDNPEYGDYPYEGIISSDVATNIGLSAVEWNIKCFRSSEGSGCQIAFPVYGYSGESPKYRLAAKHHLNGSEYSIGWNNWQNFSDNGNADTVDGKHASDFSQIISFGNTSTDTKTAIGIQYKTTTYWCSHWTDYPATLQDGQGMIIAVNYKGSGTTGTNNIWCMQLYICPHDSRIYKRIIIGTAVGAWVSIIDSSTVASSTTPGIVTTSSQHFKGLKLFDDSVWVPNPNIVMGEGAPSADTSRVFAFTSSDNSITNASAYMQNVARAAGNNELYLALRSLTSKTLIIGLSAKINADGSNYYTFVTNPPQSTQVALRNISSGTASANKTNCPSGSWYGKHS